MKMYQEEKMKIERLLDISKKQVLVFGDFMVDRYLYGNVNNLLLTGTYPFRLLSLLMTFVS